MANPQVNIESISPQPIQSEEEQVRELSSFDKTPTVSDADVTPIQRDQQEVVYSDQQNRVVSPQEVVQQAQQADPNLPPPTPKNAGIEKYSKPIPPGRFVDLQKDAKTDEEVLQLATDTASFYKNNILAQGENQQEVLSRRLNAINSATSYRVPRMTEDGEVFRDPATGEVVYDSEPVYFPEGTDEDMRVLQMFEFAASNNGAYHLFDANDNPIGGIDIGLMSMQRKTQSPTATLLWRRETEKGGLRNYVDILKRAGYKDAARLTYLAREQANADNIFEGIEGTRTGAAWRDMGKFFADIGYGEGFQIPYTETKVGFGKPFADLSATIPLYILEASTLGTWRPEGMSFDDAKKLAQESLDKIREGNISYETFDDSVTALHKEFPHASRGQIEAIMGYTPDLAATGSRFALESVGIGGTITAVMRQMGRAERLGFVDYVREVTKTEDKFSDIGTAVKKLEDAGMDAGQILGEYYQKRGISGAHSNMVAKALDMDVYYAARKPGPYYDNVIKPQLDDAHRRLETVQGKLDAAYEQGKSTKLVKALEAQKKLIQKDIVGYQNQSYLPPYVRDFLRDEGIATGVGSVAYQAVYEASNNDVGNASIAAFLASVSTALPGVRNMTGATIEDLALAFKANGEELATSRAAVKIRRHLEKAPPELQESLLVFMEDKAQAIEDFSTIRFPEGHPRAGQVVIPEDTLDQSFAHMSGLLTLRRLEKDLAESSLNIQKDAGKLSADLFELEKNFMQQSKLVDSMAQYIDSLRYYKLSPQYDPNSAAGRMTEVLTNFYDNTKAQLGERVTLMEEATKVRDRDLNKFFSGQLDIDAMEGLLDGTDELSELLAVDRARYVDANMSPDASLQERVNMLSDYYKQVNAKVNEAFEANARFTFDDTGDTANNMLRAFFTKEEDRAYGLASARFNAIRANPLYKDARMDLTEVVDAFITQGPGGNLTVNTRGLSKVMPIYGEGTQTSRYLAKLNLPGGTSRAINRLFDESAGEYLDDLAKKDGMDYETMQAIFDEAELDEAASNLDKWFAVRDFLNSPDARSMISPEDLKDMEPRLGVAPDVFMHVISSLGETGGTKTGIAARELREDLLARAPNEFYDDFYGPKSGRNVIEGFAEEYEQARAFFRESFIVPFREESSVVKSLVTNPDTKIRRNALTQFLTEVGAADEAVDLAKLNENFYKSLKSVTGGEIDVTTDAGKQIRAILTKHVQSVLAASPASAAIRRRLIRERGEGKAALVRPEDVKEIQRGLEKFDDKLITNLFRRDSDTGEYLFRDVNGEPLVDPSVLETNSFDDLLSYGIREAEEAQVVVRERIADETNKMLANMRNSTSQMNGVIDARKVMVQRLEQTDKGLGGGLLALAKQEGGAQKIGQLRDDFVYSQTQAGVDSEVARANFDQAVKDSTLEHVMDTIMKPGGDVPTRTVDMASGESRVVVERGADMDIDGLGRILGITGDAIGDGSQARAMRALLGDEIYDNMVMVHRQLFNFEPKNAGSLLVTGKSIPLSAESMLSRGTSFFRGVISLRWLISEAAIRNSRQANYALTKMMLGNPKVGREVLQMLTERKFDFSKKDPEFLSVLITEIAKFDALQKYAAEQKNEQYTREASGVDTQMQDLTLQP
jgi:hypothetical protein